MIVIDQFEDDIYDEVERAADESPTGPVRFCELLIKASFAKLLSSGIDPQRIKSMCNHDLDQIEEYILDSRN